MTAEPETPASLPVAVAVGEGSQATRPAAVASSIVVRVLLGAPVVPPVPPGSTLPGVGSERRRQPKTKLAPPAASAPPAHRGDRGVVHA
jgi:hypothetical protein